MSANNYLRIHRPDPLGEFILEDVDADTHEAHWRVGEYIFLEDAIKAANEYMDNEENEVEYGLQIDI